MDPKQSDELSEQEAERRRDKVLRHMISRPPQPHKPLRAGKAKKRRAIKRKRRE
jgi:hypothetical protein